MFAWDDPIEGLKIAVAAAAAAASVLRGFVLMLVLSVPGPVSVVSLCCSRPSPQTVEWFEVRKGAWGGRKAGRTVESIVRCPVVSTRAKSGSRTED